MASVPKHVAWVAGTAGVVAVIQALLVVVVSTVLIIQHSSCADANATLTANDHLLHVVKVHYFQDPDCPVSEPLQDGIMEAKEVRIWLIINLAFASLWLLLSVGLVVAADDSIISYFPLVAYSWVAATAAVLVIDLTLAVFFGLDLGHLQTLLADFDAWDVAAYRIDILLMGSFLLMTLSLKGFVLTVANIAFIIAILVVTNTVKRILQTSEHAVLVRGPLNAFETSKPSDPWHLRQRESTFDRNAHLNRGLSDSEDLNTTPWREIPQNNFTGRSFDRSDSWHHSRVPPDSGARPFSYLEDARSRQQPAPPMSSPAVVPPWRRDPWEQPPPVPAPDYSPISGRRLKSALKPVM